MALDRALLQAFVRCYPFQPATALFRTVEISHLLERPFPTGYGLDLGCGDGLLTRIVLERVGHRSVVGIDPDPAEAALARHLGIYDEVLSIPGDAIPVTDETFDWVFSNSVLEHIDEIRPVLREVARVLKPGGVFLFTVPAEGFHAGLRGPILPWVSRRRYLAALDARLAHRRYWSADEWRHELFVSGLTLEEASPYFGSRALRRWETIARITAGVLYLAFGRRKQPVEIQRTLGLRRRGLTTPVLLTRLVARLLTAGIDVTTSDGQPSGCLRIVARPRPS